MCVIKCLAGHIIQTDEAIALCFMGLTKNAWTKYFILFHEILKNAFEINNQSNYDMQSFQDKLRVNSWKNIIHTHSNSDINPEQIANLLSLSFQVFIDNKYGFS